ncbi:hypothetical protein [Streptomyces sp. VRA16 Mangrove soil]|uniref:hypothetical protein n=1 Tax=Streptomyces sp. VRA16 Mangrove soil TaxID=2817434 RepID=UPI001A9D8667|nr:hypothetical protein [Streptomyces sp. VRA16 Mangrove soil]MBO1332777.1 hypothetical protein [Streptomyces sp. VRA16 Mangrove soil]
MNLSRRTRYVLSAVAIYVVLVLVWRFSGIGWWLALGAGVVATPLVMWMTWLRRRFNERAVEFGRRHRLFAWPEDRRR